MLSDSFSLFKFGQPEWIRCARWTNIHFTSCPCMLNQPILRQPRKTQSSSYPSLWFKALLFKNHSLSCQRRVRLINQNDWKSILNVVVMTVYIGMKNSEWEVCIRGNRVKAIQQNNLWDPVRGVPISRLPLKFDPFLPAPWIILLVLPKINFCAP